VPHNTLGYGRVPRFCCREEKATPPAMSIFLVELESGRTLFDLRGLLVELAEAVPL
jgi:hypothetical protein